jgi:hypothetical protein
MGSLTMAKTVGTVEPSACSAAIDVLVVANRTSGFNASSSRAARRAGSFSPPVIRYTI